MESEARRGEDGDGWRRGLEGERREKIGELEGVDAELMVVNGSLEEFIGFLGGLEWVGKRELRKMISGVELLDLNGHSLEKNFGKFWLVGF